jgi:hypothetical protein
VPAADPVEAVKWHLISKAAGENDADLDKFAAQQTPETRAAAEKQAKPWLDLLAKSHS